MNVRVTLIAVVAAALISLASTYPLLHEAAANLGWLIPLSLPGVLVAILVGPLIGRNVHDPSLGVIAPVTFLFYAGLIYWLLRRRSSARG